MNKIILIVFIGFISSFAFAESQKNSLTSDDVPVFLDIGMGIAEYEIYNVYNMGANSTDENATRNYFCQNADIYQILTV